MKHFGTHSSGPLLPHYSWWSQGGAGRGKRKSRGCRRLCGALIGRGQPCQPTARQTGSWEWCPAFPLPSGTSLRAPLIGHPHQKPEGRSWCWIRSTPIRTEDKEWLGGQIGRSGSSWKGRLQCALHSKRGRCRSKLGSDLIRDELDLSGCSLGNRLGGESNWGGSSSCPQGWWR